MGRKQYSHLKLTCNRGVNQQRGLATLEECADALNVWAPDGIVEQRPGHVGVVSFPIQDSSDRTPTSTTKTWISYDPDADPTHVNYAHAGTMDLDDWAVNDFWYAGFGLVDGEFDLEGAAGTALPGDRRLIGVDVLGYASNTNNIRYESSYWNGTEFVPLRVIEREGNSGDLTYLDISPVHGRDWGYRPLFCFCPPGDWASSTINGITAFFIQFKLNPADGSTAAMDGDTQLRNAAADYHYISPEINAMRGLFVGEFPFSKRYIAVSNNGTTSPSRVRWMSGSDFEFSDMVLPDYETADYHDEAPATHAIVPQFGEGFIAYGGRVKRYSVHEDWPEMALGTDQFATDAVKEGRDFAVGTTAPFDPDYISTTEFPGGKYIVFFNQTLWIAGSRDEPYTVRWSAGSEFYKVWPEQSNEVLMEDDNSPITGMAPLGEHMVVFKRDSIWMMVGVGENPSTNTADFRGRKIVDGVGCVSHASIQKIRGRLVFLAEEGVYAFDGTPNIQKLSDRIDTTITSINTYRTAFAASAHWKTRNCYLLSVATRGVMDNDKTLVYDYRNDAWWIWDIPASLWLNDEGTADEETLYFVDNHHCMHLMGVGNTDHGAAISSHVLTQRIGEKDNIRRTVRQVEVISDNRATSLTVAVLANDDSNNDDSGTLSLTDDSEAKYADNLLFTAGTKYVLDRNRARRLSFRKQGDWLQVKVSHSTHNTPMSIRVIDVGVIDGTRR